MKWKFSSKKDGAANLRREVLEKYEEKYLKKVDKVKSEIQKIQKKKNGHKKQNGRQIT